MELYLLLCRDCFYLLDRIEGPNFKGFHAGYITIYQRLRLKATKNHEHHNVDMFTKVVEERWVKCVNLRRAFNKHLRLCSPLRSGLCRRSPANPML